jgi:SAM-dependent methyltransferase
MVFIVTGLITMYQNNYIHDTLRVMRAVIGNLLALSSPHLYIKLTGQTGRGAQRESAQQIAEYFRLCFDEYFKILGVRTDKIEHYLAGKRVLEYGPGDTPGVGLLMLAHGAESVTCVDRFPMYTNLPRTVEVMELIMSGLDGNSRWRAENAFVRRGDPGSGFVRERLRYKIRPSGLSGLHGSVDLIISRSVLEHVNDLQATFVDMKSALRDDGIAIHKVDLRSHGLHRQNPLDFLTWSPSMWRLMHCNKGYVNRWRLNTYRDIAAEKGFNVLLIQPTAIAERQDVEAIRPALASTM